MCGFESIFFVFLNTVVFIAPLNVVLLSQVIRILQILRMQLSEDRAAKALFIGD